MSERKGLTRRTPWYDEFPGNGAALNLADRFQNALQQIWAGDMTQAQTSLRRWSEDLDLSGVPSDIRRQLDNEMDSARRALASGDTSLAQYHVQKALDMVGSSPVRQSED